MLNSFEDLNPRFAQVASQPHAVTRKSAGAVGELFEELMIGGIVGNQSGADFAEIATEAKVHYRTGELTIFSCKGEMIRCIDGACFPSLKPAEIKAKRGKSTVRVGDGLTEQGEQFVVEHGGETLVAWDKATLISRIVEKMPNLAMVKATKKGETVTFDALTVCRKIIPSRFIDSIRNGQVRIELRSKGTSFRANPDVIASWFETVH